VLPLVISLEDTRAGTTARYAFIRSPVHLGRREDNDVALDDPFVSARHGLLQFDEREVRYTDLGSCNGSVLDGRRLASHAQARLGPGAVLRIGSLVLTFSRGTPEPAAVCVRGDESVRPGKITALMAQLARTPVVGAAEAWAGSLRPGLVIGRFELQREVGRGGFGIVFEARDRQLGRSVALKAVRPRAGVPVAVRDAWLQREAEAVAQLNHPNIVSLFDVGTWEGGLYLIMELLRGKSLDLPLARGPLSLAEALRVAVNVARGLAHAHAAGVVHRDLKPSNVFLTDDGWAKVLDFGLAQVFGGSQQLGGGTPRYMAPEQRRGAAQDARTDVHAAALVLVETLTGRLPEAPPDGLGPPAAHELAGLPSDLVPLLARALAADPSARPVDGSAWLAELLAVVRAAKDDLLA